jgi:hypothetical protein
MNFSTVDVRELSGTTQLDIDYCTSSDSYTAKIKNARLIALPIE